MNFSNWFSNAGSSPRSVIDGPENERGLEAVPVVVNDPDPRIREMFREDERRRSSSSRCASAARRRSSSSRRRRAAADPAPAPVRQQAYRPREQGGWAELRKRMERQMPRPASLGAAAAVAVGREKLYIKDIDNSIYTITYNKDDTIERVKEKISYITGYEKDTLRLVSPPNRLDDDSQTLESYGITEGQTIHLIRHIQGGYRRKKRRRKRKTKKRRKKKTKKRRKNRKKKTKKRKLKHRKKTRKRR